MKKVIFSLGLLIMFFLIVISCAPSTIVTTIYLQAVEVYSPTNNSPVHITDSSETGVTIFPRISFNTRIRLLEKSISIRQ